MECYFSCCFVIKISQNCLQRLTGICIEEYQTRLYTARENTTRFRESWYQINIKLLNIFVVYGRCRIPVTIFQIILSSDCN